MCESILIKPHHFVDILRTLGDGHSQWKPHPYGHNLHGVAAEIVANHDLVLQVELGADDVCAPCIHNVGGRCDDVIDTSFRPQAPRSKQQWNLTIDRRWSRTLGLASGDRISARQLCERIHEHLAQTRDVYRELPPECVAARSEQLRRGITRYLGRLG